MPRREDQPQRELTQEEKEFAEAIARLIVMAALYIILLPFRLMLLPFEMMIAMLRAGVENQDQVVVIAVPVAPGAELNMQQVQAALQQAQPAMQNSAAQIFQGLNVRPDQRPVVGFAAVQQAYAAARIEELPDEQIPELASFNVRINNYVNRAARDQLGSNRSSGRERNIKLARDLQGRVRGAQSLGIMQSRIQAELVRQGNPTITSLELKEIVQDVLNPPQLALVVRRRR